VYYLKRLSIDKLIVAQCHWILNEVRVRSNGGMRVTGESGVRNPTTVGTVHEDIRAFLLACRAQLAVRVLNTYRRDKYSV
jgi:hypothetical protein